VTDWLLGDAIPTGAVIGITDLDDPEPGVLLAEGYDVVVRLHGYGEMLDGPVLLSWHWRKGLAPGHRPPEPIWVVRTDHGFDRVSA
jgi:hypothetical protein